MKRYFRRYRIDILRIWIYTSGVIIVAFFVALIASVNRSPEARARELLVTPQIGNNQQPQKKLDGKMDTVSINQPIEFEVSGTLDGRSPEIIIFDTEKIVRNDLRIETISDTDGKWRVKIHQPTQNKRPGKFRAEAKDVVSGDVIYRQEFVWGVLAFNTNMATYPVGADAELAMAFLDDQGRMVCNGAMAMVITDPSGNTTVLATGNKTIQVNPSCSVYGATDQPDYSAVYRVKKAGRYDVKLFAKLNGGERILHDTFYSESDPRYKVERLMPTRAFPPSAYSAKILVTPRENYIGRIVEKLPDEFEVEQKDTEIIQKDSIKELVWQVNWQAGRQYALNYQFSTPNISPRLYLLGPLEIDTWQEARPWQIANDAIAATALTSGNSTKSGTSFTTASITPSSNALVVAYVTSYRGAGVPAAPTLSGNSLTWSQINTQTFNTSGTPLSRITAFQALGASPTAGAVTISFGAESQGICLWSIVEYSGVDTTTPVVQSAINVADGAGSLTVTLSAFGSADNATASGFSADANTPINNDTGWTELHDFGLAIPVGLQLETQWYNGNDTSAVGTMSAGTADMGGIAIEIKAASTAFTITGSCKLVNQTSNCANSEVVKVAYDGTLKGQTGSTSSGSWTITPDAAPTSGQVITVFVDNVANANEAVAVTKYDNAGNITGVLLYEEHLTLGSDDNQTLSNADIDAYDNSVSTDEDVFFEVDANNDLTVDTTTNLTQEELYILASNIYRPDSTSSGDVNTHDIEIDGTLTADGNNINVDGSWDNDNTFTANTSTVITKATSGTETIDSTGAVTATFNNLTLGSGSGTATWNMSSALDVDGTLTITYGTLAQNGSNNITLAGDLTINANGNYTKSTGTFTFDGSGTKTWTNSATVDDLGVVSINGTTKTVNLASSATATSVNVAASQTFGLASSGYTLILTGSGTGASRPFVVSGTLNEGTNSTVKYVGTSATDILDETYYNLELKPGSGSPTYNLGVASGGTGTAAKINDAGNPGALPGSTHQVVRTSGGTLYSFINVAGSCEIWKSTDGSSWSQQDSASNPACNSGAALSAAMDGTGTIHLVYADDGMITPRNLMYDTFVTGTDTFGTEAQVDTMYDDGDVDIAIDSSNKPHVVSAYNDMLNNNIGYSNKTGASWRSAVVIESGAFTLYDQPSIAISEDNIPEISYINVDDSDLTTALGNGNDATSFGTPQDVDTSINSTDRAGSTSIAVDTSGNTWVAYTDVTTNYATLVKHNDLDAWTTWQTPVTNSNVGYMASIAINGTDIYIFYEEDANDIAYDKYTGSWAGETVVATGTYQDPHAKWAYNANNGGSTQIDFLYSDNVDVYWNKIILSGGGTGTLTANNLTAGDGTNVVTVTADANDPTVDVNADFSIAASATYTASATGIFTVGGSWSNSGTFTHSSATVKFDAGASGKTISGAGSAFNNVTFDGASGGWTLGSNIDVNGNLTLTNGTLSGSSYTIYLAGSWTNNATFTAGTSTVVFDAGATGRTIEAGGTGAGKPFNAVQFNNAAGGWTIQTSDMKAANLTITDVSAWALAASRTLEVTGTYTIANAETGATTWNAGSVFYLNGTSQTIGSKTQTAETYATLQVGANTDIRSWNSSATTATVNATGSLYSQDHANVDGDLYIWGDYHTTNTNTDYWSYATDFDGTALAGSSRQVDVLIDPSSKVTVDSGGTLNIIGATTPNRTTVSRQGASNGFELVVDGGTIDISYTDFDYLDGPAGLDVRASSTVTDIDNSTFENLVATAGTDANITVVTTVIGAATKVLSGNSFTLGAGDKNAARTGTDDTGKWDFDTTGGEADDWNNTTAANEADPGMLVWNDSTGGNTAPNTPSSLVQKKVTGGATLATGDWTNETQVQFTATASDTDNPDTLYLCVEKDVIATAFSSTNGGDLCGTGVAYSGTPVTVSVTITGLTDASEYHWQAQVKDTASAYSSWQSYPDPVPNAESARDFGTDTTAPTGGTVYDGVGADADWNDGSLSSLSSNWSGVDSTVSGLNKYEYAIGTTAGGADTKTWTDNTTSTSVTSAGLTLHTGQTYYFSVRTTDNAGNVSTPITSDGIAVAPTLTFSFASGGTITFADLNAGNSYTDSAKTTVLQTSTNAYEGYITKARATDEMRSPSRPTLYIPHYASPNVTPTLWSGTGFGYTTNDSNLSGGTADRFTTGGPKYAGFIETGPGDPVADHTAFVSGTPITNEQFTITYRITADATTAAGLYTTTIIYTCTPQY